jgi:hypothetical protein
MLYCCCFERRVVKEVGGWGTYGCLYEKLPACKEMKAAITETFPDAHQQICIYHIAKNILLNAKKKFKYASDPDSDDEAEWENLSDVEEEIGNAGVTLTASELAALDQLREDEAEGTFLPPILKTNKPPIKHDPHGVEALFKDMVYARTEDLFFKA